ncbi:MalM family protein [Litoribrevibacter euphylliae]|uniref:MalM family protein n=1 Tax=Litoribrevibacter euphylliae TaxID=1834034 RepID=A0ABV7H6V7_9GAMM
MKFFTLFFFALSFPLSANQVYFSWIDSNGNLRNSFLNQEVVSKADVDNYRALSLSDFVAEDNRIASVGYQINPKSAKEKKQKYYTWVEADGRTHNTEYASAPQQVEKKEFVLQGGELASEYIDADQLARQGYLRDGDEKPYYTWVDPTGRLVTSEYQPGPAYTGVSQNVIDYTEGNQYVFNDSQGSATEKSLGDFVPSLDAAPTSVISLDKKLAARIQDTCCAQISEANFYPLTPDDSVYEKLGKLSPSYDFPTGHSYYIPIRLPVSQQTYGIKVKSFAQKGLFYPVLLFLDENRQPTRYVTDSVVEYHEETWDRYAHLEGRIMIKPSYGERFVLIFTTEEDLKRVTQQKEQLALLAEHEHSKTGSVEVKVIY